MYVVYINKPWSEIVYENQFLMNVICQLVGPKIGLLIIGGAYWGLGTVKPPKYFTFLVFHIGLQIFESLCFCPPEMCFSPPNSPKL